MRELTDYEREKWLRPSGNRLEEEPELLCDGDELGDAYHTVLAITQMIDYGLSDEFVRAAIVELLDMYYFQIHLYTGEYGGYETPQELGLPVGDLWLEKCKELGVDKIPYNVENFTDEIRRAWDWAMQWHDEHRGETFARDRLARAERELEYARGQLIRVTEGEQAYRDFVKGDNDESGTGSR